MTRALSLIGHYPGEPGLINDWNQFDNIGSVLIISGSYHIIAS